VARSSSHARVEALTGARAFAGVYILLLHFGRPLFAHAPRWAETLRHSGYVATSFFLLLSGFVLTIAYGPKLADGRMSAREFLVARVARVYPCFVLAIALLVPLALVHSWGSVTAAFGDASWKAKIATGMAHATMTHVFIPRFITSWNLPDWCVSVEMWFYLALPPLVAWLVARPRARTLVAVAAGAWLVAIVLASAYAILSPDGVHADVESTAFWLSVLKFTPYTRWPEFVAGAALGALWLRTPAERRDTRFATPLVAGGALACAAILLCGRTIPYVLLHNGALLPLYAAIVWGLMLGRGPLHRALSLRPLTALGDSSYVLYILQVPLLQWMVLVTGNRYDALGARFTAIALPLILAIAVAVHHLAERRAQAWLRPQLARLTTPLAGYFAGSSITSMRNPPAASSTRS
jgi:peptidoglycan/LPS O-acetylase OafA/YrhL